MNFNCSAQKSVLLLFIESFFRRSCKQLLLKFYLCIFTQLLTTFIKPENFITKLFL